MEACSGGTDVMERSCAVARGIDINMAVVTSLSYMSPIQNLVKISKI
jgi:hypothetical protein